MTTIQAYLAGLPEETKERFREIFGDMEKFYATVYLITRNEHITDMEKPDRYEERLHTIRSVKKKMEEILTAWGLDGKEIVADIASDYFEDYVAYKEPAFDITDEEFIGIIHKIMDYR